MAAADVTNLWCVAILMAIMRQQTVGVSRGIVTGVGIVALVCIIADFFMGLLGLVQ